MTLNPSVVRARGLTKAFDGKEVVCGIDLDIPRGSCFGFLGPNGAGKTTTLRMILGQSPVTAGALEVLGMPEAKNIKVIGVPRDKVVTLGRSERSDLMINDQSISNRHSKIFFSSLINKFVLQDYESKYGTLKVIQQPQPIEPGRKLYVQVGCVVIQLEVESSQPKKKSCWAKLCCCLPRLKDRS